MLIFAIFSELQLMKKLYYFIIPAVLLFASDHASAQTAKSLFYKADSLQVAEIRSETADMSAEVGHNGPAVENSHMALAICFNDSGAIDLYSKSGRGMELESYFWYPTSEEQETAATGCDAYDSGATLGFGGFALWDGENEVRLVATKGRTARVGDTKKGCFAEMISYGIPYLGDMVDVSVRIDVQDKKREAEVTVTELSGKKISFVTGVCCHAGQKTVLGDGYVSVWGDHPGDEAVIPVGTGIRYSEKDFLTVESTDDMVRLISKPLAQVKTVLVGASVKEAELNSAKRFEAYMVK